jgi:hypothetical protein
MVAPVFVENALYDSLGLRIQGNFAQFVDRQDRFPYLPLGCTIVAVLLDSLSGCVSAAFH